MFGGDRVDGGSYILYINLSMAAITAAVFLGAYLNDRRRFQALCWMGACCLVIINGAIEALLPQLALAAALRVLAYACFLAALGLLGAGLAHQCRVKFSWGAAITIFSAAMLVNIAILDMPRSAPLRLYLYHGPYFLMGSLSALTVLRGRHKGLLEYLMLAAVCLLNLHFLFRPTAVRLLGGMGESPQTYLSTPYAAYDQTVLAIVALALAALLSLALVRDIIRSLTKVSVTDPLSGLLNRRGFLENAQRFLKSAALPGHGVYLAIADIDHFKKINDAHGHDVGDKVIRAFGQLLESVAVPGSSVARLGGEEFGVLFRAPSEALARMCCENFRALADAGAGAGESGLPPYTASFGLALRLPHESIESLSHRADLALYSAKQAGRNLVALAGAVAAQPALAA